MKAIGEKYGMSRGWMYCVLKAAGIKARPTYKQISYKLDEHFFDQIDTHEKAICLGFIWADGCLATCKGRTTHLSITLSNVDHAYLEWMNGAMKNERPIYTSERFSILVAYHPQIVVGLSKQGLYPRKSVSIGFPTPEQVPDEFLSSFILGVFEGDGSIGLCHGKSGYCNIVGSVAFCKWLQVLIREKLNLGSHITYAPTQAGPPMGRIAIGGNPQILRFMNWLYSHATHKMPRKYEEYLKIRSLYDENGKWIVSPEERAKRTADRQRVRKTWKLSDEAKKRVGRPVEFYLMSPVGEVRYGNGVLPFSKIEKSISRESLFKLIDGRATICKGWRLATENEIAEFRLGKLAA